MQKTIKINGVDRTNLFTPYGYGIGHRKIHGPNGGFAIDGTTIEDVVAVKAYFSVTCMPTNEQDYCDLVSDVYSQPYATVYFFDTRTGGYRTAEFAYDEIFGTHEFENVNGEEIWVVNTITFTER